MTESLSEGVAAVQAAEEVDEGEELEDVDGPDELGVALTSGDCEAIE